MVEALDLLDDSQLQFLLLSACVGMPRFNFQLRVSPPEKIAFAIEKFDDVMYDAIRALFGNCPLTSDDLDRISLPISKSGFGIGLAKHTAQAAYVGSVFHSISLQAKLLSSVSDEQELVEHYTPLLQRFNADLPLDKQIPTSDLLASCEPQHLLSSASVSRRVEAFVSSRETPREQRVVEAALKCDNQCRKYYLFTHCNTTDQNKRQP